MQPGWRALRLLQQSGLQHPVHGPYCVRHKNFKSVYGTHVYADLALCQVMMQGIVNREKHAACLFQF
jgi:hypothetical protein